MSFEIIKGPCILRGHAVGNVTIFTKGAVTVQKRRALTVIGTDHIPNVDQRLDTVIHEIKFTPAGMWADIGALLTPAADYYAGQKVLNNLSTTISGAASGGAGLTTLTLSAAKTVYKGQYITLTGMSVSGYNGSWLVTADSSGTSVTVSMNYSASATGTIYIPPCLIIHPIRQYAGSEAITIYQNAGITGLPNLNFAAGESILGETTISAVYHPFRTAEDANSLVNQASWSAPSSGLLDDYDVLQVLTSPPRLRYGAHDSNEFTGSDTLGAPWQDFRTAAGLRGTFNLSLQEDKTDHRGIINWTILDVGLSFTGTPHAGVATDEITDQTIQALLREQDDGADGIMRGVSLRPSTTKELLININGNGAYMMRIPSAVVSAAGNAWGAQVNRVSDLTWQAIRGVTTGSPASLFAFED